jgi:Putative zinc-finger
MATRYGTEWTDRRASTLPIRTSTSHYGGSPSFIAPRRVAAYHQVVTLDSNECPVDLEDVAEAYVMGTLPRDQAIAFENHYAGCARCATVLEEIAKYVDAVRAAAKELREEPPDLNEVN